MTDKLRQSDTYHDIAHNLGIWVVHPEIAVFPAIEKEYEEKRKLKSAKNIDAQEEYKNLTELAEKAVTLYDDFLGIFTAVLSVRRALPNLFNSLDISKKVANECKASGIDEESLKAYCVAWQ
jgi:hypothetical protein